LKTESVLVSEIRTLDGERKALVYDNYSKLIRAVGTIGDMRVGMNRDSSTEGDRYGALLARKEESKGGGIDGVKDVAEKMEGLLSVVKELRPQDDSQIEETRRAWEVKKQKELVKWVLAAPAELRQLIEDGKKDESERLYDEVMALLRKWNGVKGVSEVRTMCEHIMHRQEVYARNLDDDAAEADKDEDTG
jgi:vacuolar protein sorting-associated protein 51